METKNVIPMTSQAPSHPPMNERDSVQLPGVMIPSFRTSIAIARGVEKNLIFKTWGGLGDQICAEPTLRYALKSFKGCEVSLASERPELFSHLKFKRVFNLKEEVPVWEKYLAFDTILPPSHLQWEFMSHMITNCVDYPTLCSMRAQLPIADKVVHAKTTPLDPEKFSILLEATRVKPVIAIHPGRHWPIKTFPADWWNSVIARLIEAGITPVLVGADTDDNRGTVEVNASGCIDLRNKMSVMETFSFLQRNTDVLLTNDSSPLHMAVTGSAWIGFVATCKHPDLITHWRNDFANEQPQWSWRMENLGRGGIWDEIDHCPNKENEVKVDQCSEGLLRSWLPEPCDVVNWALRKLA